MYNLETIAYYALMYTQFKSSYIGSFDVCRIENELHRVLWCMHNLKSLECMYFDVCTI